MASGTVTVNILGNATSLKSALVESESALAGFQTKMSAIGTKLQSIGRSMTMKVTLPIVAGLGLATKAAIDEDKEMATLANTLRNNVPGATQATIDANEKWITSFQNLTGVMDDELRPAMGKLLIAGQSIEQAHHDIAVAADIAAARHLDLASVVQAMSKAAGGNVTALQRMGIQTKDAAGKTLSFDQILQNASKTMGGAAATAANTTAGQMAILKAKLSDLTENIGRVLIPIVTKAADIIGDLAVRFGNLSPTVQQFIVIGLALLAAVGPVVYVLGALATAIGILASPVALIIIGIAALVAGVIYAYTHFETFRDIVDGTISTVQRIIEDFVGFVEAIWRNFGDQITAIAMGTWNAIYGFIAGILEQIRGVINIVMGIIHGDWGQIWEGIKGILQGAWDQMKAIVLGAMQALAAIVSLHVEVVVDLFHSLPGKISSALGNLGSLLYNAGKAVVQGLINGIEDRIGALLSTVKKLVGIIADHLPGSPVKTGPLTVLNNGRAGKAIVKMLADGMTSNAGLAASAMAGVLGGGGRNFNLTVNAGMGTNGAQVGQQIVNHLKEYERGNGSGWRS